MIEALVIVLAGVVGGFAGGVLGVGGGMVLVPIMAVAFGFPQTLAQGTSLAAMIPASIVGAIGYREDATFDRRVALVMAAVGTPGAVLGAYLAIQLPNDTLARLFALFLLGSAWRLWPRQKRSEPRVR